MIGMLDFDTYFRARMRSAILGTASQMIQTQFEAKTMAESQGDPALIFTESVDELIKTFAQQSVEYMFDCELDVKFMKFDKAMLMDYTLNLVWDDKDLNGALAMMALALRGYHINTYTFNIILKDTDVRNHFEVE